MTEKRGKSKIRTWCENAAKEFGCVLEQVSGEWRVVQKSTKKIAYRSKYLPQVQIFLLREIGKYINKRIRIVKEGEE